MSDLDRRLLAAHAAGDHLALVTLYRQAAEQTGSAEEAGFFLTQAYVFALETAHPDAAPLRRRLQRTGREAPDPAR